MATIKAGLLYTKEHDWIRIENDTAYIGITDYAQSALGDIVFIDGELAGSKIVKGGALGAVESIKAASDIVSPLSGEFVGLNEEVVDDPALVNREPFEHHIFVLKISDPSEADSFLDDLAYASYCEGLH